MDRTWKGLAHVKMQAAKTNPSINPYTILQNPIPQIFTWRSKFWCELSTLSTSIKWIYQMNLPSLTIPDPSRTSASSSSFSAASATICVRCRCTSTHSSRRAISGRSGCWSSGHGHNGRGNNGMIMWCIEISQCTGKKTYKQVAYISQSQMIPKL